MSCSREVESAWAIINDSNCIKDSEDVKLKTFLSEIGLDSSSAMEDWLGSEGWEAELVVIINCLKRVKRITFRRYLDLALMIV